MKTASLLSLLFLSACATPGDLSERKPTIEFSSEKSPQELASCVTESWSKHFTNVHSAPMKGGYSVWIGSSVPGGGSPGAAWITPAGDKGSSLRFTAQYSSMCSDSLCKSVSDCE